MDVNPTATAMQHALQKNQHTVSDAFAIGASAVNRIGAMVSAALHIASGSDTSTCTLTLVADLLKEARHLTEDLSGILEDERDVAGKEGK